MGTQLAAIVVTDVVGSTELRARIGEDAADALRRDHDQLLTDAVERAGGSVVKGLGDGVLARFGGAAEAVDAAVAIQRAACALTDTYGSVELRVGVAVGDVTLEDEDVFGTPVIEASRLCAAAERGQIVVADLVRVLSHGRGDHRFADLGALDLKGLAGPIAAASVEWAPAAAATATSVQIPVPGPLQHVDGFPFAGRADAVERLAERWKRACVEGRQLVLVTGEPGIGKTRLVSELARRAAGEGAVILLGRCFEDLQVPYGAFVEALAHLVAHAPDDLLCDHVAAAGGDLTRLVPELASRIPGVPPPVAGAPEQEQYRLQEAVVDLLARVGEHAPVLLVLDDLHWADASTVGMVLWLVRATRPMRLAVVGTYRDTDIDRSHPLGRALAELRRSPAGERVSLTGLDLGELTSFLEQAGGQSVDAATERLAELLESETEGNPFFVGEVLRHLVESGVIRQEDGRWVGDPTSVESSVPEGVRDVVGRRLSALSPEADQVLRAASVLGTEFDLTILAALVDRSADELVELLDEPCQRRLLSETDQVDRYRFAHALIHQTLNEELPAGRRARLHRTAADAIVARAPEAHAEIARHLVAAGPLGDPDLAVAHAAAAGDAAVERRAWEDAVAWYRRAVDLDDLAEPDGRRRAAVLLALGSAMNAIGHESPARQPLAEAADLARDCGDPDLFARVAATYGGPSTRWVDLEDVRGPALLDEALELLPDEPSTLRTRVYAQRAAWEVFATDLSAGLSFSDRALEDAAACGDPEARLVAVRAAVALRIWLRHDDELARLLGELEEVSASDGNANDLVYAGLFRTHANLQAGDIAGTARTAMETYQRARELGARTTAFFAGAHLNLFRIASGRFEEALAFIDAHHRPEAMGAEQLTYLGLRYFVADVRDDAEDLRAQLLAALEQHRNFTLLFPGRYLAAALLLEPGDVPTAQDALRAWNDTVRPHVPQMYGPALDADACLVLADVPVPEVAARCYETLLPWAEAWVYPGPGALFGAGHHLLGVAARAMGERDDALAHLRRGLQMHEAGGLPLFIAMSHLELARTEEGEVAQRHRDESRRLAEEFGVGRIASRIVSPAASSP